MAVRRLFNDGWLFQKTACGKVSEDWSSVDIPHDWLIHDSLNLYESSVGRYKKEFQYQKTPGERVFVRFDGVYMDTTVHINGKPAAEWKYGYSTFELEITDMLIDGVNLIEVACVYRSPNSRWYSGAGIYRNVWFVTRKDVCIAADGIYVSSEAGPDGMWTTYIDTEIDFSNAVEQDTYSIRYTLSDAENNTVQAFEREIDWTEIFNHDLIKCKNIDNNKNKDNDNKDNNKNIENNKNIDNYKDGIKDENIVKYDNYIDKNDNIEEAEDETEDFCTVSDIIKVENPILWDVDNPYRYTLTVSLYQNNSILETEKVKIGYKITEFTPDEGFLLNGRKLKLKGVCNHHDLGALGAAVNSCAIRRQITILKEMGVNAIRTAHNMAAPELIEAANDMGILINAESFDMWECSKTEYDYARFFKEWHAKDVKSWIRRDRNAPCVIMWSIGNEIYDTHKDEHGQDITKDLMSLVHKYDYRHNAPVTIGSNYMPWENAAKCADIVKLAGYNYAEAYYEPHHREHTDWIIYGSETGSVVQSRGIYHFPENVPILYDDDLQCSSLGNSTTSWGAKSIEACITDERDAYYSAGMFIWSGFDYIGEPTPYHTKNSYFGQVDTAGFPKDSYYVYQSAWTDYRTSPMVHIYPYWDFNEGQMIDVCVCSNAPEVELCLNGKSYGRQTIDHEHGKTLIARWKIPYQKGTLLACAYDEHGNVIAKDETASFGDAVKIVAHADRDMIRADGRDLVFVEISAVDKDGRPVHNANNRINVDVTGAGRLIGLDNGDSTDYDSYKGLSRCLFSGKLLAIVAADTKPGTIHVSITSKGLEGAKLTVVSEPADAAEYEGVSANERNLERYTGMWMKDMDEVPIRKLKIKSPFNILTKDNPECEAYVEIYPSDATYSDISYRITTDNGVTSNLARLEPDGKRVRIEACGDGRFRLRCSASNNRGHDEIISELEFEVRGVGKASLDAYEMISASMYSHSAGEISSGNERGAATPRDHESYLYYDNIEFGEFGSDLIHIPIFELENRKLEFEIWEGEPYSEGAKKLLDAVYDKPSIWNTYQEETFTLPYRLRGTVGIGFVFRRKAHIKGFYFDRINKAFEKLYAGDSNSIYGDSYTVSGDAVTGIGNNVTFVYDNMDFGETGADRIKICGRSGLDNNTIHVRFKKDGETINKIVEFKGSSEYTVREFDMGCVTGECEVMLIFLPGCNFDLKWFKFIKKV